jgi:arabinogalactan oligomer/maltooligosaccharide transport system permease protein
VDPGREARNAARARRRLARPSGVHFWIRTIAVGLIDAALVYAAFTLVANEAWTLLILLGLSALLVNWAYLNPRANASRWLTPGLVLMAIFVVYPVVYTAYVSFTNWQTGNILTKAQVIESLEAKQIQGESGQLLTMSVYRNDANRVALLVSGEGMQPYMAVTQEAGTEPVAGSAIDLSGLTIDPEAPPEQIDGFSLLSRLQATGLASQLENSIIYLADGREVRVETLSSARIVTSAKRFAYDPATDTLHDAQLGLTCRSGAGTFFCDAVPQAEVSNVALQTKGTSITCTSGICDNVPLYALDASLPGWRAVIGVGNYTNILSNARIRTPFLRVLSWNVAFAALSVLTTFALGLGLAMALQDESMRGRSWYRSIYILPYAVPGFLSIFIWRGLLNAQFGQVNGVLQGIGLPAVNWLGDPRWAMGAVLLVNLWLGFPYMFLISSGALTSIPQELLEAARVDGASPVRSFRSITLPLLLVSTAPLLIGSFAFNFNNFILIYLLTSGGPPLTGFDVPVGATDLLISFTFRLAQSAGRGNQFGLSSAIVVVIFLVLATVSAFSFRLTKRLEDIYE